MATLIRYCLFIAILCCTGHLQAQPKIGITLGVNAYKPSVTHTGNTNFGPTSTGLGLVIGLFAPMPLSKQFFFRPSAELSFRTFKEKRFGNSLSHPINYLDLSLPVVYASAKKGSGLLAGAGPALNFLLNPAYQFYPLKKTDLGLCGLVGYEIPLGFVFSVRYTLGLTNISANSAAATEVKNRVGVVSIGYVF
jgi:hypothetical protein